MEYVSETIGSTSPGDPQLIVDNTLAPGAQVKVQSSHTGLRSRLWKVVTVDGVEQTYYFGLRLDEFGLWQMIELAENEVGEDTLVQK